MSNILDEIIDNGGKVKTKGNLRHPRKQSTDTLIGGQVEAYNNLIRFTLSGHNMYCFEGVAGAGKSFCINMFLEEMIHSHGSMICACAPTHKAKVVLQQMAEFNSENLDYSTIHSLLGLKPIVTAKGEEKFIKDHTNKNKVGDYDYIVIDESSMLDDMLFAYLLEELDTHSHLKIIFVGDNKQLPPVNHVSSAPMDKERREKYEIGHSHLTEIVRQKGTNPIINLSKEIREGQFAPKTVINDEGCGVVLVPSKEYKKVLKKLFTSGKYEENPNYCRVVAWTNACVTEFNQNIRKMIYQGKIKDDVIVLRSEGNTDDEIADALMAVYPFYRDGKMNLPKYVIGDKLIADKPIFHPDCEKTIVFQTNEELIITDIVLDSRLSLGQMYKCYVATVKNLYTGKYEEIEMIHEESQIEFDRDIEKLRSKALAVDAKNGKERVRRWRIYYTLEKRFARLKYAPSLTTYKSQGSTYENIIIIAPDILKNRKNREMLQHLYVALTRASKRAFIFI
jgi:exodeoxyribonuclease-5